MYNLVLLMALGNSPALPSAHREIGYRNSSWAGESAVRQEPQRHRRGGCYGCYGGGCYGCYGGCYGCSGGYSCSGGYVVHETRRHGGRGSCYGSCYGCYGGYSCAGGYGVSGSP